MTYLFAYGAYTVLKSRPLLELMNWCPHRVVDKRRLELLVPRAMPHAPG